MKSINEYLITKNTKIGYPKYNGYILYLANKDFWLLDTKSNMTQYPVIEVKAGHLDSLIFVLTHKEVIRLLGDDFRNWNPIEKDTHLWGFNKGFNILKLYGQDILNFKNKYLDQII